MHKKGKNWYPLVQLTTIYAHSMTKIHFLEFIGETCHDYSPLLEGVSQTRKKIMCKKINFIFEKLISTWVPLVQGITWSVFLSKLSYQFYHKNIRDDVTFELTICDVCVSYCFRYKIVLFWIVTSFLIGWLSLSKLSYFV